jgi:hypothetical protein
MIRALTRKVRTVRRALEAGRREMRLDDAMAYQGETWNSAQWGRAIRYSSRLHRVAHGRSPWFTQQKGSTNGN